MIGPFARREGIGMARLQAEVVAAVLQRETPARRHNPGTKSIVIAVDERTGIPLAVYYTEINCI